MDSKIENQKLNVATHLQIIKKLNIKAILWYLVFTGIGTICFVAFFAQEIKSSNLSIFLMMIGSILILTSLILLLFRNNHNVYEPTGSPIKRSSYFFHREQLDDIAKILSSVDFSGKKSVSFSPNANMRMDVLRTIDEKFATAQLFEYIPHNYEPVTKVHYYTENTAKDFLCYLKQCKA